MTKVLIPVDGSEGSHKAIRFALALVEGKEAQLILLNVQHGYNTLHVKRFFSLEEIHSYQEELSKEVFKHALENINQDAGRFDTVMRIGDPGSEICKEAKERSVDYIVMGYRGLGIVKRAIMGSVATHVLHETPCPVMIVP